ncbi:MAG: outer membrane protein assembly factor BamA [Lentisphaeraceae bacterium]|nr:outer membrane protein assembly factor BamA [Lentisphaeraceae bacterium]
MKKLSLTIIFIFLLTSLAHAYKISEVKFVDDKANVIPVQMFSNYIGLKGGSEFTQKKLSDDIKRLYETKKVKDVKGKVIVVEGEYQLIFTLTLNVIVAEIGFEGNNAISEGKLEDQVEHPIGVPMDMEQLAKDKAKIFETYAENGNFNTQVNVRTDQSSSTGEVKVIFEIKEETSYQVDSVTVVGVSVFDPDEIKDEMKTQPSFWRYFFDTGFLNEDLFKYDLEQLQVKYESRGYLDFKVLDIERVIEDEYINLILYVKEGEPYTVNEVSVHWMKVPGKEDGGKVFEEEEIRPLIDAAPGLVYNRDAERADIRRLEAKYNNLGYLEFSCRTILKPDTDNLKVNVEYHIYEGTPSIIRDIKIVGNSITKDHVIRRELAIQPSDLSNKLLIEKSKNRLMGLGYFQSADIIPNDTGIEGEKDLTVKVEEQETGRLNFGAGVSSASSFVGSVGVQQSNFDIDEDWPYTGGGQKLRASLEAGAERSRAEVSFVEPWLNNKPLSLSLSAYHATRFYDEMDEKHTGVTGSLTSAMKDFPGWRFTRGLRLEFIDVDIESEGTTQQLQDEAIADFVSVLFFNFSKDTRNSIRRPTKGGKIDLSTEFQTSVLGSANDSYKLRLSGSEYFGVFDESIIKISGEIGMTDALDDVPIYDRFFAGGLGTIRGYEFRKVGPMDALDDELGGNSLLIGSIEIDVPLFKRVNGAWFIDAGNVWEGSYDWDPTDINITTGPGIRLDLPIGMLRLDYGFPIRNVNQDDSSGRLHFNFGYQF